MRRLVNFLVLGALLAAPLGCRQNSPALVHSDSLAAADLQFYWQSTLPLTSGEKVTNLYRVDDTVYCTTSRNRLVAMEAQRGLYKWALAIGSPSETIFPPAHADKLVITRAIADIGAILQPERVEMTEAFDAVLVNTETRLMVIDRNSGRIHRDMRLPFPANTGGCTDGRSFFVASTNGVTYMVRLNEAISLLAFNPDAGVNSAVECGEKTFYLGTTDGTFHARGMRESGSQALWSRKLSGAIMPAAAGARLFVVESRGCFVPCADNRLYALDLFSGKNIWDQPFITRGPLVTPVQISQQTAFQYARGDQFYAINIANGQQRWSMIEARLVAAIVGSDAYLVDSRNNLLIVDELLGTLKSSVPLGGYRLVALNTTSPAVWVASADGQAACIRPISAGQLRIR